MGTLSDWVRKGKRAVKKNKKSLTHAALAGGAYFAAPYVLGAGAAAGAGGAANAAGGAAAGGAAAGGAAAGSGGFWSGVGSAFGQGLGYAGAGIAANAGLDLYNRISGKPTNPYEQGQAAAAYNQGAYPGTTPWEQLGGQKPQATDLQVAREQRAHEAALQAKQLDNQLKIVQMQTGTQRDVAGIGADATVRASGQEAPDSPASRSADAAVRSSLASLSQAQTASLRYELENYIQRGKLDLSKEDQLLGVVKFAATALEKSVARSMFDIVGAEYARHFQEDIEGGIANMVMLMLERIDPSLADTYRAADDTDPAHHSNILQGSENTDTAGDYLESFVKGGGIPIAGTAGALARFPKTARAVAGKSNQYFHRGVAAAGKTGAGIRALYDGIRSWLRRRKLDFDEWRYGKARSHMGLFDERLWRSGWNFKRGRMYPSSPHSKPRDWSRSGRGWNHWSQMPIFRGSSGKVYRPQ